MTKSSSRTVVTLSAQGRVSIPAPIRRELGLTSGAALVSYVEDGRIVLETREHLIRRIQATAIADRPAGVSVVNELLADRRADAGAEQQRMET